MTDLQKHIEGLYKLHLAGTALQHAARQRNEEDWMIFEPSQFVYTFFTFNTLYSMKWEESYSAGAVLEWGRNELSEQDKIHKAIKFCLKEHSELKGFQDALAQALGEEQPIMQKLVKIKPDKRTKRHTKEFRDILKHINDHDDTGLSIDKVVVILEFIYLVRCNIFHGNKTTVEMLDPDQRVRLRIYAKILETFNRTLLEVAETRGMWKMLPDKLYLG